MHLQSLDPVSESLADYNSYGFRKHRSCADAIARCFSILLKKDAPNWILEGDIPILRHPKIKGSANPYDSLDEQYFEQGIENNLLNKLAGKHMLRYLYQ